MDKLYLSRSYRRSANKCNLSKPDFHVENYLKHHLIKTNSSSLLDQKLYIAGVDEAGRGPLAGPIVSAAVIFSDHPMPNQLNDSKKISARRRAEIFEELIATHIVSFASACPARIDAMNIRNATLWTMKQAIYALGTPLHGVIIDGQDVPSGLPCPGMAVIKGDSLSLTIAAASIVAKVIRDRMMQVCHVDSPLYRLNSNMGYGTEKHRKILMDHGGSRHHRQSFSPLRQFSKT